MKTAKRTSAETYAPIRLLETTGAEMILLIEVEWNIYLAQKYAVMACRPFGIPSLSELMLIYCQLGHEEQPPIREGIWKCRLQTIGHFIQVSMCQQMNLKWFTS